MLEATKELSFAIWVDFCIFYQGGFFLSCLPGIAEVNRKVICYYTCRGTKLLLLDPLPLFSAFHNNAHPTIIAASNTSLDLAESKNFMLKLDNQMWSHPTIIAASNTSNNLQLHLWVAKETKWQIVKDRVTVSDLETFVST